MSKFSYICIFAIHYSKFTKQTRYNLKYLILVAIVIFKVLRKFLIVFMVIYYEYFHHTVRLESGLVTREASNKAVPDGSVSNICS